MRSALVIGATGTVGAALFNHIRSQGITVTGTTRRQNTAPDMLYYDMTPPPEQWPVFPKSDVAFICAGAGRLDVCENEPVLSRLINVERTIALTNRLLDAGMFVVFISTNQVFSGEEGFCKADHAPSAKNEYGLQKTDTEKVLLSLPRVAILRATKIISSPFPLFEQWRQQWADGKTINGFEDLFTAPIPIVQTLEALMYLGEIKQKGIYHISGPEEISFYDLALLCADMLRVDRRLVNKSKAIDHGIPANFIIRHPSLFPSGLEQIAIEDTRTLVRHYMETVPGIKAAQ